jgi:hypothetical protein
MRCDEVRWGQKLSSASSVTVTSSVVNRARPLQGRHLSGTVPAGRSGAPMGPCGL